MVLRGLLLRISFNPKKINKVEIIVKKRIKFNKTKSIAIKIKKVWEWVGVNIRAI